MMLRIKFQTAPPAPPAQAGQIPRRARGDFFRAGSRNGDGSAVAHHGFLRGYASAADDSCLSRSTCASGSPVHQATASKATALSSILRAVSTAFSARGVLGCAGKVRQRTAGAMGAEQERRGQYDCRLGRAVRAFRCAGKAQPGASEGAVQAWLDKIVA